MATHSSLWEPGGISLVAIQLTVMIHLSNDTEICDVQIVSCCVAGASQSAQESQETADGTNTEKAAEIAGISIWLPGLQQRARRNILWENGAWIPSDVFLLN